MFNTKRVYMQSLFEVLEKKEVKTTKKTFRSERDEVMSKIYSCYEENFAATKSILKKYPVSKIAYFLSHIKTPELYYVLEECGRKNNVGGYLTNLSYKK